MQRSKGYRKAAELIDINKLYEPVDAVKLAKETSPAKFDATVEVAMRLGVDPRKADQMVRGTVNLPHGTGKTARVIVFAQGAKAEEAVAAGADEVGTDELVARIQGGWLDFDAAIATPDQMAKIGRIARILGPRGLMPNPKTGTVTMDVTKAINEIKGGKITFRVDKHSNLHLIIGKASFSEDQLVDNYAAVLDEVLRAKPSAAKGKYLKKVTLTTTMGPGVQIDPNVVKNITRRRGLIRSASLAKAPGDSPGAFSVAGFRSCVSRKSGSGTPGGPAGRCARSTPWSIPAGRSWCSAATAPASRPCSSWPPACCARCRGAVLGRPAVVGWVPERFPADQPFTAGQYLHRMAEIRGQPDPRVVDGWLERLLLDRARRHPPGRPLQGHRAKGRPLPGPARPARPAGARRALGGPRLGGPHADPADRRRGDRGRRLGPGQRPPRRDHRPARRDPLDGRRVQRARGRRSTACRPTRRQR